MGVDALLVEDVRRELGEWRAQRAAAQSVLAGLSCGAYLHAGRLEVSGRVVRHRISFGQWESPKGGVRGEVRPWSKASRRRLRCSLHRVRWERHSARWVVVTLTLPGSDVAMETDGRVVKGWLRAFLARWSRADGARPMYAWKLEFQRRGAAHFAIVLPVAQERDLHELRALVARWWFEVVGSGSRKHLAAGTQVSEIRSVKALSSYMVGEFVKGRKSKEYQHEVPIAYHHVGRWWAVSRGLMEPWAVHTHEERQAYRVRRAVARMAMGTRYARVVRRVSRHRVGTLEVFTRGPAWIVGWQLQGLRG